MVKQKVYLMKNEFNLYKIGISVNPEVRARDISNNSGVPTKLVKYFDSYNARDTEQKLHQVFSSKRKKGEWFHFTKRDIDAFEKAFRSIDDKISCNVVHEISSEGKTLPCLGYSSELEFPIPKDMQGIVKIMRRQLNWLSEQREVSEKHFSGLIDKLLSEEFHVPYVWRTVSTHQGLSLPTVNVLSPEYPICKAEVLHELKILHAQEYLNYTKEWVKQAEDNLEKLKRISLNKL